MQKKQVDISKKIKQFCNELGFLESAILPVDFLSEEEGRFKSWLTKGMNGEMQYMTRNVEKRLNPKLLVEGAKTIIIVLLNYFPSQTRFSENVPVLSKYAYGEDYHITLKEKLHKLYEFIKAETGGCGGRFFTDSAPVLEKAWARRAGLGWIGKNSNLISLEHGSFFFIGELIIDIEIPYDNPKPVNDHCGTCTRCVEACPTKAIVANRVVDARKCISYQTIELKGDLDPSLKNQFENRVFGCDICQDVCPWNLKSKPHNEPSFFPHPDLLSLTNSDWYAMNIDTFNILFGKSAVKRTGFKGLMRNLEFIQKQKDD